MSDEVNGTKKAPASPTAFVAGAEAGATPTETETGEHTLMDLVRNFVADLLPTFPELADSLTPIPNLTEEQFITATAPHYANSFFYLLQKNDAVFTEANKHLEFLPGIDFRQVWKIAEELSEGTRDAIWKHLQLIMFNLIPKISDKSQFGDSASLFEAITPEQLQEQLEAAFADLDTGEETTPEEAEAAASQFTEHISGLMGGNLGRLATEIAEEVGSELGLTRNATQKEVMELLRDPMRMIKLVKKIGNKLQEKIASGEVKESELLEEAAEVVGKLKEMPGAERLRQMFGGAAGSKASQAATKAALNQRIGKAKTRERLQAKLAAKRAEMAATQGARGDSGGVVGGAEVGAVAAAAATSGISGGDVNEWLPEQPQSRSAPRKNGKKGAGRKKR